MSEINKPLSDRDYSQVIQRVSNDLDASLTISGFVTSKVGNTTTYRDLQNSKSALDSSAPKKIAS